MPTPGTVFQIVGEGSHAWVVISKTIDGLVLCVNMTDERNNMDSPCRLQFGDHPFITKKTVMFYKKACTFDAALIDKECFEGQRVRRLKDCSPEILDKIIAGARRSDDMTAKLLNYLG